MGRQSQSGGKHESAHHVESAASPRESGRAAVTALERRLSDLEELATSQDRELRIRFERIAQLQAEWDILRIRFTSDSPSVSVAADCYEGIVDTFV